ncbi:ADP-ribosylglycohydrolase family protein [Candidatus Bathyarchaeota archaeon]|nr:ADP-ribosylglycohydrolase family protein [Candidatus Bathyarchaeota archaeon]
MPLWDELASLPVDPGFPYEEPSEFESIRKARPKGPRALHVGLSDEVYLDKVHGAWLGRCVGCLLGKPVEGWPRERIEGYLKLGDAYPLDGYIPEVTPHPEGYRLHPTYKEAMRGAIDGMPRDDDIDYTILGLHVLEEHGIDFTTANVGAEWLTHLPYKLVYTAERVAYRNLVNGLAPPETASHRNPYREYIGAQIRGDIWGYVAPGLPEVAAELAFRDASLSHTKNGIYGEMFAAAMISAAFSTQDIREVTEVGLSEIPRKSRLAEAVRDVLDWSEDYSDWRQAWEKVMESYGGYHWVHTINNAAFVVLGLIYGGGDLGRSVSISVMAGFDTDCNGATAGSVVGAVLGAKALPEDWVTPLGGRVRSILAGFSESSTSDLARRTCVVGERLLSARAM